MDYLVLEGNKISVLEGLIEDALEDGWVLVGGVAVVWDGRKKTYYQAVTGEF